MMAYEPPDYYTHIGGGWFADGFVTSCTCPLTIPEEKAIEAQAEDQANGDDDFGVTHWEDD